MPRNALTGRQYSGVNVLLLWGAAIEGAYPSQCWMTFKQALEAGGNVRKGEAGTTVCYADRFTPKDEQQKARDEQREARQVAFLKRFTNAPQLVVLDEGEREGLFAFDPNPEKGPPGDGRHPHNKLVWDKTSGSVKNAYPEGIADGCDPALDAPPEGHYTLADGTRVVPAFALLRQRVAALGIV